MLFRSWIQRGLLKHVLVMGLVRVPVAAVAALKQLPAVEQLSRTSTSSTPRPPRRMGSTGGKISQLAAKLAGQAEVTDRTPNGSGSGGKPLLLSANCLGNETTTPMPSAVYTNSATESTAIGPVLTRGGGGAVASVEPMAVIHSSEQKILPLPRSL